MRAGFEASACDNDPPIKSKLIIPLRLALANATTKAPRERLTVVMLESIEELHALGDCFSVGGEGHPRVTEDQWDKINELIDQAIKAEGPFA